MINHNYLSVQNDFFGNFLANFTKILQKKGKKGIRPRRESNPGHLGEPLNDPSEI